MVMTTAMSTIITSLPSTSIVQPCFVTIDTDSKSEQDLFEFQRIICGWKHREVPKIFEEMRRKQRVIYWLCIPSQSPIYLSRTGTEIVTLRNGDIPEDSVEIQPLNRTPHGTTDDNDAKQNPQLYLPIGHISIDLTDLDKHTSPLLGSSNGQIVSITTLFVLHPYRKSGIAKWAMAEAERLIRAGTVFPDLKMDLECQQIGLSTLSERHYRDGPEGLETWNKLGVSRDGARYLGGWYRSLGYEKIMEMEKFEWLTGEGEIVMWWGEIWGKAIGNRELICEA